MMMPKSTTKKNVSFTSSEDNKIHHIESSISLVGKDCGGVSELWYTSNEFRRIQIRAFRLCHDLKKSNNNACNSNLKSIELKHNGDTSRGLEFFYDTESQQAAKTRRSKSRTVVVTSWKKMMLQQEEDYHGSSSSSSSSLSQKEENENQRRRNNDEIVTIARTYSSISQDAVQHAIIQAQYDRNYVLECEIDELMMKRQQRKQQQQVIESSSSTTRRRKRKNPFDDDDNVFSSTPNTTQRPAFRKRQFATVAC